MAKGRSRDAMFYVRVTLDVDMLTMWTKAKMVETMDAPVMQSRLSRRLVLQELLASTCLLLPANNDVWAAASDAAQELPSGKPAIVVRTTENVTQGSWVWLIESARDAGIGRIYLLMKQDENDYISERTDRTWTSGELLAPVPGGTVGAGWEDPAWLDEMLARAKSYRIEVHAWWPCFQDAIAASQMPEVAYPGRETEVFLDPAIEAVGNRQRDLIRALLRRFPFDGIALDWLRYNSRADGSAGPLAIKFAELTNQPWSDEAMSDPVLRAIWDDLRAQTIVDWVADMLAELRPSHPQVKWSAFLLPWMFKEVAQSYRHLSAAGLDSILPMIYWRDWNQNMYLTSDVISPAPFYLSGQTSLGPTFDINTEDADLLEAFDYLPRDQLGQITWYNHGEWSDEDFVKVSALTEAQNAATHAAYVKATPVPEYMPANVRVEKADFNSDASIWAVICLGELYKRGALDDAEPIIPVLAFHRFFDGAFGASGDDWYTSTGYLDALIGILKAYEFDTIPIEHVSAFMTSGDSTALPRRPLAITIDDGSATAATIFEPRAAAANLPYALALVTGWLSDGEAQMIDVGDGLMDRNLTWPEVVKLAETGRVSVISHTHLQHRYARSGLEGGEMGAAIATRLWLETENRLESDQERLSRVYQDLAHSRDEIARRIGRAPNILVWPFGLFNDSAEAVARQAGYTHFLEFVGNSFAAPRQFPRRIMRVAVTHADESVPLAFPKDEGAAQRWWLAFQMWARGGLLTVSGAFTAFRASALRSIGGWNPASSTEDIDASWRLQSNGWRLAFETDWTARVEMAPTDSTLWRQRRRWSAGLGRALRDHGAASLFTGARHLPIVVLTLTSLAWMASILVYLTNAALFKDVYVQQLSALTLVTATSLAAFYAQLFMAIAIDGRRASAHLRSIAIAPFYPIYFWCIVMTSFIAGFPKGILHWDTGTWNRTQRRLELEVVT